MHSGVEFFVEQGSYGIMLAALLIAGLGFPLPEDIVLISGGILIQRGITTAPATVAVCVFGVLFGDFMIFTMAQRLGPKIYERKFIKKVLTEERRAKVERLIGKYGGLVVFCTRHLAGLRAPIFAMTAIHGMNRWKFLFFDTLGLAVSLPIVMYLGYLFANSIDQALFHMASIEHYVFGGVGVLVLIVSAWHTIRAVKKTRE